MKNTIFVLREINESHHSKHKDLASKYADQLALKGWKISLIDGAAISPDGNVMFIFGRVPYIGQLQRVHFGIYIEEDRILEKMFYDSVRKYVTKDFIELPSSDIKDVCGKIAGYISYEKIAEYIKEKYNTEVEVDVQKRIKKPLSECKWVYTINDHSEDNDNYYEVSGLISFRIEGDPCGYCLRYLYSNITTVNQYTNPNYFRQIVEPETTEITLNILECNKKVESVNLIKEIISNFGGGWMTDDKDSELYYPVNVK